MNVGDSASSSKTALALAQGLLLHVDMQKEAASSPDRLVSTGLVSGIKVSRLFLFINSHTSHICISRMSLNTCPLLGPCQLIQKMVVLGQKMQEIEPERNRLLRDNTKQLQTITRLERERDKAKLDADAMKVKLDSAEDSLSQALSEMDSAKKATHEDGYQKGFDAATASYIEQMPAI